MPKGSRHDEQGLLLSDRGRLVLRRDDGGHWRLEADWDAYRMVGQRVRVQGVRCGFDLLDVEQIARAD
jgi:hypothetical protein